MIPIREAEHDVSIVDKIDLIVLRSPLNMIEFRRSQRRAESCILATAAMLQNLGL